MAWTTSACLCARPSLVDRGVVHLKSARYLLAATRRSALRARPALFLSLSAVSLGFAAPLLPTSLVTAILIVTGISLAVVAAGANLAGAITSTRTGAPAGAGMKSSQPAPKLASTREPNWHPMPAVQLVRTPHRPLPAQHDWAELMARIHHELRTPLNAVLGFSEVMALEMFGPLGNERYRDYVRYIRESAGDLLKSAEDTLALTALLTHPRGAPVANASTLEHAIADAWSFVERKAAARGIALELTTPPEIEVLCEPRALRQILINVLSEGIARAMPGSSLSLLSVADGELIEIVLSVGKAQPSAVPRAGSLAICLARTLLEMQGTSLLEIETTAGGWSAVTVLDRAVQPDFFAGRLASHLHREPALAGWDRSR